MNSSSAVSFVHPPQMCSADNPELELDALEASYSTKDFYTLSPVTQTDEQGFSGYSLWSLLACSTGSKPDTGYDYNDENNSCSVDEDGDGYSSQTCGGTDCNDSKASEHPGASNFLQDCVGGVMMLHLNPTTASLLPLQFIVVKKSMVP